MYNSLGEYNQAKDLFEKELMITQKNFGENHDEGAISLTPWHQCTREGEYTQAK